MIAMSFRGKKMSEDLSSKPVTDAKDVEVLTRALESLRAAAASKKAARAKAKQMNRSTEKTETRNERQ